MPRTSFRTSPLTFSIFTFVSTSYQGLVVVAIGHGCEADALCSVAGVAGWAAPPSDSQCTTYCNAHHKMAL